MNYDDCSCCSRTRSPAGEWHGDARRDGSDWDVLAELDRLRTTNSGLTAEVQRQTHIGQDYARVASEQRVRVEELERETPSRTRVPKCSIVAWLWRRSGQTSSRSSSRFCAPSATGCRPTTSNRRTGPTVPSRRARMRNAAESPPFGQRPPDHAALGTRGPGAREGRIRRRAREPEAGAREGRRQGISRSRRRR